MIDVTTFPVMLERCATCPFNEGGDRHLRQTIEARSLNVSQTCHHTGAIHGKPDTHLCRGARDFQLQMFFRMGFLSAATDEAWEAKRKESTMKFNKATYSIDIDGKATITLHFQDTDPSMPQMDNMVSRELRLSLSEWMDMKRSIDFLIDPSLTTHV